jgi:hypothetical protein
MEGAFASGLPVLVSQFESDCYPMRASHYDLLRTAPAVVIGWGGELYPWLRDVTTEGEGSWIARANDRWKTLVEECAARVISMPAMVDTDELCFRPLALRRHRWAVPGTRYRSRARARAVLGAAGERVAGGTHYLAMKALSGLGFPLYSNRAWLDLYNGGFTRVLRDTQYVYTCGSAMRMAIRKYFEIPAAGAVLVCEPCEGFAALGFVDGVNAIAAAPEEIVDRVRLIAADERAQALATAGQTLIRTTHSIAARARQMRLCLDALLGGRFRGAAWRDGAFVLR